MYLNCHSYFSFKYGTLSIESLLNEAQRREVNELALTDINNTSGCLDFIRQAQKRGIKPVVGVDFRNGIDQKYVCVARNNEGFYEINRFLSLQLENNLMFPDRAPDFTNVYVIYPAGKVRCNALKEHEYIGVKPHDLSRHLYSEWKDCQKKCVVLNTVTFAGKKDFNAHRLLRSISHNTLLSKLSRSEQAEEKDMMICPAELLNVYKDFPCMAENAVRLLNDCSVDISFGGKRKIRNKMRFRSSFQEDKEELRRLTYDGIVKRYGIVTEKLKERVEKELELITRQNFCSYFLINWDIVQYARSKGYFYVGRGSGANSIVAYALQITDVDPEELDLYFERFMNEYRVNPPDFDIDFSWKDREDVTDYIFRKHGTEHTALLATYSTLQSQAAIRELGKVFGLPKSEIDKLTERRRKIVPYDDITRLIVNYAGYMQDFPMHLSIHAGGVLISEEPIHYLTATNIPPKGYRTTQFSMIEAEDVGLFKFDILSQRGLGHIKDTVEIVKKNKKIEIDIHQINKFKHDERIKELLRNGTCMGCFYVESPSMRMLLKKLECDTYLSLVAASSIIRPGVAQSGMMREYIQRYRDPSKRTYLHPRMEELMKETYGIMVYQEDVIRVAHYFAGLTLAESDVLRRGMSGKFRGREEFQKAEESFIKGCRAKGYDDKVTFEVWRQVESFAGYSFSKGHSASYAVESYQSLFLKAYFPLEFMVGVINNFGGFYKTEFYVHEARIAGANIEAPCINKSEHFTCIYGDDIYLGFIHMAELEQRTSEAVLRERNMNGPFTGLPDFVERVSISREQLRIFIRIGAFRFTGKTKKELLWQMFALMGDKKMTQAEEKLFSEPAVEFRLPELSYKSEEDAFDEMEILGFPLSSPFKLLVNELKNEVKAKDLMTMVSSDVEIAGYLVCIKYTRTTTRKEMMFATFLDQDGRFFDTTHFPNVCETYPFTGKGCYMIKGKVVEDFGFPSIEVSRMERLALKQRD